jgi:hypothetical protein
MRIATLAASVMLLGQSSVAPGGETFSLRPGSLELEARLEPLTDTAYGLERERPEILVTAPHRARDRYDVDHFRRFLPTHPVQVGDVWPVDPKAVLPFLRQVIPVATDELHHGPVGAPGAFACLRWASEDAAEIVLRAHAEFHILAGSPPTEFWLTPAQFLGRMRLDRRAGTVSAFELLLPDARANVDVNVRRGEDVVADIGRIPRLEVRSGALGDDGDHGGLSLAAAEALLAKSFYPSAGLEWLELPAALAESRATGKPMHVLTMFGSLLDESC